MTKKTKNEDEMLDNEFLQKYEELENQNQELQTQIANLTSELNKYKEVATNSQSQYVSLKIDFDSYILRMTKESKENEVKSLIKVMKNILPVVEELRKSIENMPAEFADNASFQGMKIVYDKFISKLAELNISEIQSLGLEPDAHLHEPLGFEPSEDLKGKIVQEYERGFVYSSGDTQIVIRPAKVIIGQ